MSINFLETRFASKCKFHWDFHHTIAQKKLWLKYSELYDNWLLQKEKNQNDKIPKIIHQIWLGEKPLPNYYQRFKKSWISNNPDYKYILWDENNSKELLITNQKLYQESKNPGLRSDLLRYEILNLFGGIYVDTDFECIKSIPNELLKMDFVACMQFEDFPQIGNSLLMSQKGSKQIVNILKNCKKPNKEEGMEIMKSTGPFMVTEVINSCLNKKEFNMVILPSNYCFPIPNFLKTLKIDVKKLITKESFGIHHWELTWLPKVSKPELKDRIFNLIKKFLHFIKK
tara:strand:+ start:4682 stop:5536 length:855 start_codon:yes stop_codon:yes gene_type:complete